MIERNVQAEVSAEPTFKQELTQLINKHGIDAQYTIPDYIIANYLNMSLSALKRLKVELLEHGVKR